MIDSGGFFHCCYKRIKYGHSVGHKLYVTMVMMFVPLRGKCNN